jgi:methyl-accepting chemotaxis protein
MSMTLQKKLLMAPAAILLMQMVSLAVLLGDLRTEKSLTWESFIHSTSFWLLCLALLVGVACMGWVWLQQRDIVRDLAVCSQATHDVSAGKLDVKLHSERTDELGDMMRSLGAMVHHLHSTIELVQQTAHTISAESQAIARDNNELKARTGEQVTSLEETVHAMRNITAAVTQNADNASTANQLAESASQIAVKGGVAMEQVVSTMNSIDESSRTIADIVGVIDTIAFQTNLLALNAAVEAARAGPQGKGFAVVATEVRHLAQRSAHAAKEIKALITKSVEKVGAGAVLVNQAGITMKEIVSSVNNVNQILGDIATASQNQRTEIEAINQSVGHIDEATQKNRSLVDHTASAAVSLQKRANYLTQAIGTFQLEQRASKRVQLAVPGQLHMVNRSVVAVQVVDISQTGVGITLKEKLPQHQRVDMEFAMPVQGHNQRVMVQGRVVYCVANDAGYFKAGLEFVDMQAGFKENLNALTA